MADKGVKMRIKSSVMPRTILIRKEDFEKIYPGKKPPRYFYVIFAKGSGCCNVTPEVGKWLLKHHLYLHEVTANAVAPPAITAEDEDTKSPISDEPTLIMLEPPPPPIADEDETLKPLDPPHRMIKPSPYKYEPNWKTLPWEKMKSYAKQFGVYKFGMKKWQLMKALEVFHDD